MEDPNSSAPDPNSDNTQVFPVEKVLKTRLKGGKREFLIKWAGNHTSSWEPETNLSTNLRREYFKLHHSAFHLKRFLCIPSRVMKIIKVGLSQKLLFSYTEIKLFMSDG